MHLSHQWMVQAVDLHHLHTLQGPLPTSPQKEFSDHPQEEDASVVTHTAHELVLAHLSLKRGSLPACCI